MSTSASVCMLQQPLVDQLPRPLRRRDVVACCRAASATERIHCARANNLNQHLYLWTLVQLWVLLCASDSEPIDPRTTVGD